MWRDKIQISQKGGKPVQKPTKTNSVSVGPGLVSLIRRFFHWEGIKIDNFLNTRSFLL